MTTLLFYGFVVKSKNAKKMFSGPVPEGPGFDIEKMLSKSIIMTEQIMRVTTDFEYWSSDKSLSGKMVGIVGVQIAHVEFCYGAPLRVPSVTEEQKTLLDKFVAKNPAFNDMTPELVIYSSTR